MRSEILKRIIADTPQDVRDKVRIYGDALIRAYNLGFNTALLGRNKPVAMEGLPSQNDAVNDVVNDAENKHGVMQSEGSDGAEGAAVGQRSVGTNAEAKDCETCKHFWNYESYPCSKCDEDYSMWEAPPEGALPR
jgi:hypothetical protein